MNEAVTAADGRSTVEWHSLAPDAVSQPIVRRVPYLELKLEHPGLERSAYGSRFFPDAVPYERAGTPRVFYWRSALGPSSGEVADWVLACATTHELAGVDSLPADVPPLVTDGASGATLVVDGTVAGDTTTTYVESYATPTIAIDSDVDGAIQLTVDGTKYSVSNGERRRIQLTGHRVEPVDGESTTVNPQLTVRYPGRREIHHPARGATYRLFPSFGLDLADVSNPLPVPTHADELNDLALATVLDIDSSQRPYPEQVLWQAFAYTAFDPHAEVTPELAQLETGHILVRTEAERRV